MTNLQLQFFEPGGQDDHSVSVADLGAVLTSIQRVFNIIGELDNESEESNISEEQAVQPFTLFCAQREAGCYEVPLEFGPAVTQGVQESRERMVDNFFALASSVEGGVDDKLLEKFADEAKLKAALTEMIRISGHCSDGGAIILKHGHSRKFDFHGNRVNLSRARKAVTKSMSAGSVSARESDSCVIVNLKYIDAEKFIMYFEYSTEKVPLTFSYAAASPSLAKNIAEVVKSKHNPLEIHGDIKFNDDGYPEKITQLKKLNHVNLGKVVIKEVTTNAGTIKANKPLTFYPSLDETGAIYVVEVDPFGDILFEKTRDYLVEEIEDYFSSIWNVYVMKDDEKLSECALELKATMLENFKLKDGGHETARNRVGAFQEGIP